MKFLCDLKKYQKKIVHFEGANIQTNKKQKHKQKISHKNLLFFEILKSLPLF